MKQITRISVLSLACAALCSCVGMLVDAVGPKPVYHGPTPPSAITDAQVKAGQATWLQRDPYELPASSQLSKTQIKYASDGTPYGIDSPYRDCIHSPYNPFPRLSIKGMKSDQIVYDPYARKPFRLP